MLLSPPLERTRGTVGGRAFVQAAGHADMRERLWTVIVFMIMVIIWTVIVTTTIVRMTRLVLMMTMTT